MEKLMFWIRVSYADLENETVEDFFKKCFGTLNGVEIESEWGQSAKATVMMAEVEDFFKEYPDWKLVYTDFWYHGASKMIDILQEQYGRAFKISSAGEYHYRRYYAEWHGFTVEIGNVGYNLSHGGLWIRRYIKS